MFTDYSVQSHTYSFELYSLVLGSGRYTLRTCGTTQLSIRTTQLVRGTRLGLALVLLEKTGLTEKICQSIC